VSRRREAVNGDTVRRPDVADRRGGARPTELSGAQSRSWTTIRALST